MLLNLCIDIKLVIVIKNDLSTKAQNKIKNHEEDMNASDKKKLANEIEKNEDNREKGQHNDHSKRFNIYYLSVT